MQKEINKKEDNINFELAEVSLETYLSNTKDPPYIRQQRFTRTILLYAFINNLTDIIKFFMHNLYIVSLHFDQQVTCKCYGYNIAKTIYKLLNPPKPITPEESKLRQFLTVYNSIFDM